MSRKILLVSNMYPSDTQIMYGVFVRNIEKALNDAGFEVSRLVISGRGHSLFDKIRKYMKFYWDILREDLSLYDAVHISYPSHSFLPFFLKRRNNTKIIIRLHGHDLVAEDKETLSFRSMRLISLFACQCADGVIVPSAFFQWELSRLRPALEKPVLTIPSGGVDLELFRSEPRTRLRPEEICFGYVGRLDKKKGVDLFIRAFSKQDKNCRAMIVGDGPFRPELVELIKKLGVEKRCDFIGPVPYNNLPEYYNKMDVLIFPTLYRESFGNVMLEAMACAVPVIASDHGAPGDFITDGENGFKITPGDLDALSLTMTHFKELSKKDRDSLRECAERKSKQYSFASVQQKYFDYVLQIVS